VGTGSFYQAALNLPGFSPQSIVTPVSNEWLHTAVQTGVLGFVVLGLIYGVQWKMAPNELARLLVASMVICGLVDTPLLDAVPAHFYAVFTALLFASVYEA